jgi:lysophospholipase L1-like esterase
VPSTVELFIDEIWPSVTFSDVQASTVRTWNASYASWCAANDATLVRCYDAIGVNRGSTAYVDSQAAALEVLAPAYDSGDGVHPSDAGVNEMAALVLPYL